MTRATQLSERGLHYVDCGTSGGSGASSGLQLMIGGEDDVVAAPRPDIPVDRSGRGRTAKNARAYPQRRHRPLGYLHCGPNGAGHFVKMVHNGIEYGMMAAIAEGLSILEARQRRLPLRLRPTRDNAAA